MTAIERQEIGPLPQAGADERPTAMSANQFHSHQERILRRVSISRERA